MPDRFTWLLIRQGLLCVAVPVAVAFLLSSPGHAGFWVALVGVFSIMVPGLAVVSWARNDIRRMDRADSPDPD